MVSLKTNIAGITVEPPLILASGILGQTAESLVRVLNSGMGGAVTKSTGLEPREGHPNPTVVELETGLLNAMGLPNPGIDVMLKEIKAVKEELPGSVLIGSVYGTEPSEFAHLAGKMEEAGVDGVELNLSCPHADKYGATLSSDEGLVRDIISDVKKNTNVPVFVKLPPLMNIVPLGELVEKAGADAIVAVNTVKSMAINVETRTPILGNKFGGYSGPGIKPIGLRCVYELYEEVDIPIIGCGGVSTGRDVLEYMIAGASAVEIGSAFYYRAIEAGKLIVDEMKELLEEDLTSIIGQAH